MSMQLPNSKVSKVGFYYKHYTTLSFPNGYQFFESKFFNLFQYKPSFGPTYKEKFGNHFIVCYRIGKDLIPSEIMDRNLHNYPISGIMSFQARTNDRYYHTYGPAFVRYVLIDEGFLEIAIISRMFRCISALMYKDIFIRTTGEMKPLLLSMGGRAFKMSPNLIYFKSSDFRKSSAETEKFRGIDVKTMRKMVPSEITTNYARVT